MMKIVKIIGVVLLLNVIFVNPVMADLVSINNTLRTSSELPVLDLSLYQAKEGESLNKMLENVKEEGYAPVAEAYLTSESGNSKYLLNVYAVESGQTTRSGERSITYIASTDDIVNASSRAGFWEEQWDKTTSVLFSMTVTYVSNADNYIKMTNVKGNYSIKQSGIQITNQKVTYRQMSAYTGIEEYSQKSPTSSTFNYNTGFSKYVPNNSGGTQIFGAGWTATIKKGASTWGFEFLNYKYL